MKKVTKKDLNERLLMVETLLGLHRVLPEQISNEQATNAIFRMQCALSSGKELAEREQPKPKQLDQSVFDGLDAQWRFAVMQHNGYVILCNQKPFLSFGGSSWDWNGQNIGAGGGYDATNWRNSLIEREKVELTGSDLCRAMLERGDKYVLCFVSDFSDDYAANQAERINLITHTEGKSICAKSARWKYAVPINTRTGEPLTASEVGL